MRNLPVIALILLSSGRLIAQSTVDKIINPTAVESVEKVLSADDMRGRAIFSPEIEKAADYISAQFKEAGLQTLKGSNSYRQTFSLVKTKLISVTGVFDSNPLPEGSVAIFSPDAEVRMNEVSGYQKHIIKAGDNFGPSVMQILANRDTNKLVLIDTSFSKSFPRLIRFSERQNKPAKNVIFVLTALNPEHYSIEAKQDAQESPLANVVGILPGKSKKNEFVIFSSHYDHLGVGKPDSKGDSIYNGANDDASGSTAVILLAKYFGKLKNNERTLVFVTFTGEESGGLGSNYFSHQFDPSTVMAMFNIEMIGTESKWGTNSAYLTGYEKSDMGKILQKNLQGSPFTFYPDPYPDQQLFYRSDNATLARQGVPAHTISTSKMDSEKYYHTPGDEISTLDMNNMAQIIRSIALSSQTIVAGKDTPSRVDATQLH